MPEKDLRQKLSELHSEIKDAGSFDDESREVLKALKKDIEDLLSRPQGEMGKTAHPLAGRLRSAIQHFEVSHPNLAMLMDKVIDSLNRVGL